MRSISKGVEDFISLRRSFGFAFEKGAHELRDLALFLKKTKKKNLDTPAILDWLESHSQASHKTQSVRLGHAHTFAKYWKAFCPLTQVPDRNIANHQPTRARPYIYTSAECRNILRACFDMRSAEGHSRSKLYQHAYYTIYGLIMTTGLRRNEAVNLRNHHIDLVKGTLFVELTKFRKSRLIPLDSTTVAELSKYLKLRNKLVSHAKTDHFFLASPNRGVSHDMIYYRFVRICHQLGIRPAVGGRGARLHDLRHTFAVRVIQRWLVQRKNIHEMMPLLSSYMGHDHPSDTYWYLTGIPEILKYGLHKDQR